MAVLHSSDGLIGFTGRVYYLARLDRVSYNVALDAHVIKLFCKAVERMIAGRDRTVHIGCSHCF